MPLFPLPFSSFRRWVLGLLSISALAAAFAQTSMNSPLAPWHDRARPLLLFAASAQDPRFVEQLRLLDEHAAAVHDRDLVVLPIVLPVDGANAGDGKRGTALSPQESASVRRKFHVAPEGFTVILVGKDGGEKLRAHEPLSIEKLTATIDAMPMRQDEMRSRPK